MVETLTTDEGHVLATDLEIATSLWSRFIGLMGRRSLPAGHGLWLAPCSQVHTFFCRFPMDVAFVDRDGRILHIAHAMRPWRVGRLVFRAKAAVELPGGTLRAAGVDKGARLVRAAAGGDPGRIVEP